MTQPEYGQPDPQQSPYSSGPQNTGAGGYDYSQPQGQPTPGYGPPADQGAYGYGQPAPQYGYGQAPEHPQAQTVFILGIVGIFFSIAAFIAWYLGAQARKEIQAGAPYPWDGKLKTGYLLGKIISIIAIVVAILTIIWVIFVIVAVGTTSP